jgi:hypothetical protein
MRPSRRVSVPLDANPLSITGKTAASEQARRGMQSLFDAWNNIARASEDDSVDKAELAGLAQRAVESGLRRADQTIASLHTVMAGLDRRVNEAIQPRVSDALASEIRSAFRAKPDLGAMVKAAAADPRVSSALTTAPAFLSGADEAQIDVVRLASVKAHAENIDAELQEAAKATRQLAAQTQRITTQMGPLIKEWQTPSSEAMEALKKEAGNG